MPEWCNHKCRRRPLPLPTLTYQKMNNRNQQFCFEVYGLSCGDDEFDDKKRVMQILLTVHMTYRLSFKLAIQLKLSIRKNVIKIMKNISNRDFILSFSLFFAKFIEDKYKERFKDASDKYKDRFKFNILTVAVLSGNKCAEKKVA